MWLNKKRPIITNLDVLLMLGRLDLTCHLWCHSYFCLMANLFSSRLFFEYVCFINYINKTSNLNLSLTKSNKTATNQSKTSILFLFFITTRNNKHTHTDRIIKLIIKLKKIRLYKFYFVIKSRKNKKLERDWVVLDYIYI